MVTPLENLKNRLACGEITIDQYKEIFSIIEKDFEHNKENLLYSIDEFFLYETHIENKEKKYYFNQIKSLSGSSYSRSLNFLPMEKSTYLTIHFLSDEKIRLGENRAYFAWKRHSTIYKVMVYLCKETFKNRLDNLIRELLESKIVLISKNTFGGDEYIYLTYDGFIIRNDEKFNIKKANSKGMFGIGVEGRSLGLSSSYEPNQIAIFNSKGLFGGIPMNALTFTVNQRDVDITNSLIKWMSEPGNYLC